MLDLHDLKGIGYHYLRKSRSEGESGTQPLAFLGLITVAIGATMLLKAAKQSQALER